MASTNADYDYLIIGTGMAALSAGALLANKGAKVCMLESNSVPGGYAHTFAIDDYQFCAQVHYIWGCSPNQTIYEFVNKLGLIDDITFEPLNPEGYDLVSLPDKMRIQIPFGFDKLINNIEAAYPGQREALTKFCNILSGIQRELRALPEEIHWWNYITHGYKSLHLVKYKNKTLQNVFDECGLNKEAQAILCADAGDFAAPPEVLSMMAYTSLFAGYNEGAYYPSKHFKYFVGRIARFITEQPGCDIIYNQEVTDISLKGNEITGVTTAEGKTFQAKNYICNMDPQKAAGMIGWDTFPSAHMQPLKYEYSPSSFVLHMGVEGTDLRAHGFGNYNIWHLEQWDMNKMWKEQLEGNFDAPWLFISTSSLNTQDASVVPPGGQILFVGTVANYDMFANAKKESPEKYQQVKDNLAEHLLDLMEARFVPSLRQYLKVKSVGTPLTNESFCLAPKGNCYGSLMNTQQMGLGRLNANSPWKNFYWCNASGGYAGIHGTISTGVALYYKLTGDQIVDRKKISVEDSIRYAKRLAL